MGANKMLDASREQFERRVIGRSKHGYLSCARVDMEHVICAGIPEARLGEYVSLEVRGWWEFWQASREAVTVELPEPFERRDVQGLDYGETVAAIEAQGIKVKP